MNDFDLSRSDLIGTLPKPITLYHITKSSRVNSILKKGLKGSPIYLASSPSTAIMWREWEEEDDSYGFKSPMTVLEVQVSEGTRIYEDPEAFGEGGAYYIYSDIPPGRMRVIRKVRPGRIPSDVITSTDKVGQRTEDYLDELTEET